MHISAFLGPKTLVMEMDDRPKRIAEIAVGPLSTTLTADSGSGQ